MSKENSADRPSKSKWFVDKIRKLFFGKRDPENENNQENEDSIRRCLLNIREKADELVNSYYSESASPVARPYLENKMILRDVLGLGDLVSEASLRDFSIWPSEENYAFPEIDAKQLNSFLVEEADELTLPNNFFREDSFIVLCIPNYAFSMIDSKQTDNYENQVYDVTVLYCGQDNAMKLMSEHELSYRRDRMKIDFSTGDLVKSPLSFPQDDELVVIPIIEDRVPVWLGNAAKGYYGNDETAIAVTPESLEMIKKHYRLVVKGTIAYRLIRGTAQKGKRSSKLKRPVRLRHVQPDGLSI